MEDIQQNALINKAIEAGKIANRIKELEKRIEYVKNHDKSLVKYHLTSEENGYGISIFIDVDLITQMIKQQLIILYDQLAKLMGKNTLNLMG